MLQSFARAVGLVLIAGTQSVAQEYRNLDGGRPVRIEDAAPTEHYGVDLDPTTLRVDRLSHHRGRIQFAPRMAYGILPNTEISLRVPLFLRERGQSPRSGMAGIGLGAMHQLRLESMRVPAIAVALDAFIPTGAAAARTAFSAKALATRNFSAARLHVNAAYGTYSVRVRPKLTVDPACVPTPSVPCPTAPPDLPPIDGPCSMSPGKLLSLSMNCAAAGALRSQAAGEIVGNNHWLIGAAIDKAIPLRSVLFVADVFGEHFQGLGRRVDWTAEVGARHQVSPWLVIDAAVGRHYYGTALSSFVTFGTTITRPVPLRWP